MVLFGHLGVQIVQFLGTRHGQVLKAEIS